MCGIADSYRFLGLFYSIAFLNRTPELPVVEAHSLHKPPILSSFNKIGGSYVALSFSKQRCVNKIPLGLFSGVWHQILWQHHVHYAPHPMDVRCINMKSSQWK